MEQIISIAEQEEWTPIVYRQEGVYYAELSIRTPAGEDFCITVDFTPGTAKGFTEALDKYVENFDVDEETYIWLGADGHGCNGAPYHIKDILQDKEWSLNKMKALSEKVKQIIYTK